MLTFEGNFHVSHSQMCLYWSLFLVSSGNYTLLLEFLKPYYPDHFSELCIMSPTNSCKLLKVSCIVNIVSLLHVHVLTTILAILAEVSYKGHVTKTSRTSGNVK